MLSTMELIVALKEISLFAAVRGEGLKRISDAVRETRIASGELIFAEQDRGDELHRREAQKSKTERASDSLNKKTNRYTVEEIQAFRCQTPPSVSLQL